MRKWMSAWALVLACGLTAGCAGGQGSQGGPAVGATKAAAGAPRGGGGGSAPMVVYARSGAQIGAVLPERGRVVEVRATEYRFQPARIAVKKGERITIRLRNVGKEKHEWESEGLHAEVRPIAPGTTGEVTFVAPNRAGVFAFACHVDGHAEKGMTGFVVVK